MSTSFVKGVSPTGAIVSLRLNEDGSMVVADGGITAIAPHISDIPLSTVEGTDYTATYSLTNVRAIAFQVHSGGDIEFRYDLADAFYPLEAGVEEVQDFGGKFTGTLYLRSSTAGTIVVIKEVY